MHYKFIFSPNNSGTTIMSHYLSAHINNSYLPPFGNNEGQWAPKVKKIMRHDPWNPDSTFDWQFIKKEWDILANEERKEVFIESSPPNILRVSSILNVFKDYQYIFSISSPYSYVASCIFNYFGKGKQGQQNHDTLVLNFDKQVELVAREWVKKAVTQKNNIESHGGDELRITYEDFCANPLRLLDLFGVENLGNQVQTSLIKGKKNSKVSEIVNMLPKHIAFLGLKGILEINSILKESSDLMAYHGYEIISIDAANKILSENILLAFDGQDRRIKFNNRINNLEKRFRSKDKK